MIKFQFHYGSIKGMRIRKHSYHLHRFNSTMVRLKGAIDYDSKLCLTCFNSTMVRLKGLKAIPRLRLIEEFQFHYGSIKGNDTRRSASQTIAFQFHYGSIKGHNRLISFVGSTIVSIPLWFD